MSAFAALADTAGDETDIKRQNQKKAAADKAQREQEADRSRVNFDDLRAGMGAGGNWADSEDEEEDFFAGAPSALAAEPRESVDESEDESEEDDEMADTHPEGHSCMASQPTVVYEKKKKDKKKDAAEEEVDSLMASLEVEKSASEAGGISKAAAKRAKKKAQEAEAAAKAASEQATAPMPAAGVDVDAVVDENEPVEATAGKSAEDIKKMMAARAAASKKKKSGGANAAVAAATASKGGDKKKNKKDKANYNQQPK